MPDEHVSVEASRVTPGCVRLGHLLSGVHQEAHRLVAFNLRNAAGPTLTRTFAGLTCVAVVEAKRRNPYVTAVINQAGRCAQGLLAKPGFEIPHAHIVAAREDCVRRLRGLASPQSRMRRGVSGGAPRLPIRLFSIPRAFAKLERRPEEIVSYFAKLERRLEEIVSYFVVRTPPRHQIRSAYLGDHTAIALLHGVYLIYVDTRGIDIAPHLLMHGDWEPDDLGLFARMIRPGDTVLDVGAHLGVYSVVGAAATGATGQVHSFEPNPRLAQLQRKSVLVNGFGERAMLHEVAVGAAEGMAELVFTDEWAGGGHLSVSDVAGQGHRVRVVALDDIFTDPNFRIGVMKMDVEGTEGRALQGMRQILARSPEARILMEFAPAIMAAQGFPAPDVLAFLAGLGFQFWNIGCCGVPEPTTLEALATVTGGVRNIVASRTQPMLLRA